MPHDGDMDLMSQADFESVGDENISVKCMSSEGSPSDMIPDNIEMHNVDSGVLTLKGTVYPGMGIFDAAEEEQRRKRNQRKPAAVLERLEINSTLVNTEENVFDIDLHHQRTRDVYDDPSSDEGEVSGEGEELAY